MHERTTRGIKHWGLSGYSNILPRIKFGVTGQESSPQSPTISYRQPSDCLKTTLLTILQNLLTFSDLTFQKFGNSIVYQ